jgi:hypothetical protein
MMQMSSFEYYRARERAERKAAEEAQCPQARRVHEELALAYARLSVPAVSAVPAEPASSTI